MSELNPVRIAVIGAGAMGRNHIRFVTEEPEAELVAIADAFQGARATAEAAGVPFFTAFGSGVSALASSGGMIALACAAPSDWLRSSLKKLRKAGTSTGRIRRRG